MHALIEGLRYRLQRAMAALCVIVASGLPMTASAEVKEVQLARGFAIPHLPIMIMEHDKLLEKHALAARLGEIKVVYSQIGGGSIMNDSLLSGALSFGVGGPPPMLTLWDKTRSGIQVKGVCAEATMPLLLNTGNPNLKTMKDSTEKDKIAVGAVIVSIQARLLQAAAAKAFGEAEFARFDPLTVGMNSPDASAALRSGAGEACRFELSDSLICGTFRLCILRSDNARYSGSALIGESSYCLWLLVKGVNIAKWNERISMGHGGGGSSSI